MSETQQVATMNKPTCASCLFLDPAGTTTTSTVIGTCHRYPPTGPNGGWPIVRAGEWCGEFVVAGGDSAGTREELIDMLRWALIS